MSAFNAPQQRQQHSPELAQRALGLSPQPHPVAEVQRLPVPGLAWVQQPVRTPVRNGLNSYGATTSTEVQNDVGFGICRGEDASDEGARRHLLLNGSGSSGVKGFKAPETGWSVLAAQRQLVNLAARQVAQRVFINGEPPVEEMKKPNSKSLLYGIREKVRTETASHLNPNSVALTNTKDAARSTMPFSRKYTIDQYNEEAGLTAVMKQSAAIGIIRVRMALRPDDPTKTWASYLPEATVLDEDVQAWILALKMREVGVGLFDLGNLTNKINEKKRYAKNQPKGAPSPYVISSDEIRDWLSLAPDTSIEEARRLYTQLTEGARKALDLWIYEAFFRRASRIGLEFTLNRKQMIHFNLSGRDSNGQYGADGLKAANEADLGDTTTGGRRRMITISELRKTEKLINNDKSLVAQVNYYNEHS